MAHDCSKVSIIFLQCQLCWRAGSVVYERDLTEIFFSQRKKVLLFSTLYRRSWLYYQIYFGHFDALKVWMFQGDLLCIDYSWILVLLSFPIPVIVSEKGINYPKRGCPGYLEWLLNVKAALASQHNAQLFILLEQLAYIRCLLSTDSGYPCTITNPRSGQVFIKR